MSALRETPEVRPDPDHDPVLSRGLRVCLLATAFAAGFAITGVEIALGRLLAPHFGSSLAVWASIMAAIIGSMAVGYPLGGWLADRHPSPRLPFLALLFGGAASALLALVMPGWLGGAMAGIGLSGFAYWSRLGLALGAFGLPCLVMAAVTPAVLRATLRGRETVGLDAGLLYALGSLGSVLGILLPALWWIPLLGLRTSFAIIALLAALPAAAGLITISGKRSAGPIAAAALALTLSAALPNNVHRVGADDSDSAGESDGPTILYDRDSGLQHIRVLADDRDGHLRRWLQLDEGWSVHSATLEPELVTHDVWDWMALSVLSARAGIDTGNDDSHTDVAILGLAGGTVSNLMQHYLAPLVPGLRIVGVELDPKVIAVADEYLALDRTHLTTVAADARVWLRASEQRFDLIIVDAYRQPSIPAHLSTREFFEEVASKLEPGGLAVLNVFSQAEPGRVLGGLATTWSEVFPEAQVLHGAPSNGFASRLLFSRRAAPLAPAMALRVPPPLQSARHVYARQARGIASAFPVRAGTGRNGVRSDAFGTRDVWTDDRAPVELWTDLSYRATRPANGS